MTNFTKPASGFDGTLGLHRLDRWAVCLVAFVLPALNGRPFSLNSGFFCFLVAIFLLLRGSRNSGGRIEIPIPVHSRTIAYLWASWALLATVSTLTNLTAEALNNLLWGYWVPFFLFLSLVGLKPSRDDFQWIFGAIAFGLTLRFGYGAWVFYLEWGALDLNDLVFAHFDLGRMNAYMDATFGSTGNSASILTIALPVLIWSRIALVSMTRMIAAVIIFSIVIVFVNMLITGSRSALIISAVVLLVSSFKIKLRGRFILLLLVGLAALLMNEYAGDTVVDRFSSVLNVDRERDASVDERFDSIILGLGIMIDHPFVGVGPGMTAKYNIHSVAHQFAVAQGGELGIPGFIIVMLFAGLIVKRIFSLDFDKYTDEINPAMAFQFGAFAWVIYAMATNIPTNSGPAIPWIGMLSMFLAFSGPGGYFKRQKPFGDSQGP